MGWILTVEAAAKREAPVEFQCRYRRGVDSDSSSPERSCGRRRSFNAAIGVGWILTRRRAVLANRARRGFNAAIGVGWILTYEDVKLPGLLFEFQCRYRRGVDSDGPECRMSRWHIHVSMPLSAWGGF